VGVGAGWGSASSTSVPWKRKYRRGSVGGNKCSFGGICVLTRGSAIWEAEEMRLKREGPGPGAGATTAVPEAISASARLYRSVSRKDLPLIG